MHTDHISPPARQRGAALFTALILLVIMTLLGMSSMTATTMEERMAANLQEGIRSYQAALTGLTMALHDDKAFETANTKETDGTANDSYPTQENDTVGGTGANAYDASTTYNSVYRQATRPPRGSGWDSSYAYYHFSVTARGNTASGSTATVHAGAYQVGRAQ